MKIQAKPLAIVNTLTLPVMLALSVLMLSGCATLSKDECRHGDWQSIGYRDGVSGHSASYISEHQKACARVDVSPDYQAWEKGRKQGLKEYCTESNAYQRGKQGLSFSHVCPADISDRLDQMHRKGKTLYDLRTQIKKDRKELDKYQEELKKLGNGEMLDFKTEKEARRYMMELHPKMAELEKRIENNENRLERLSGLY